MNPVAVLMQEREAERTDSGFVSYPRATQPVNGAVRPLFLSLGIVFVGMGYLGYVVPGLPGTIFFILALWAFKKSSPKFEHWLLYKSVMGPTLLDWERDRSMKMRTKILAIGMLWVSILGSTWVVWSRPSAVWLVPVLVATAIGVTIFIWTRPTSQPAVLS